MSKKVSLILAMAMLFAMFALPSQAEAAEFVTGPSVIIEAGTTVKDDVYAAGGAVTVQGTIDGDLIAAGNSVNVEGIVNGDVIAGSGNVTITGTVRDNVRAGAGQIHILSSVGGDVVVGAGSVIIDTNAVVGRDLIAGTGNLEMRGTVERDAKIGSGQAIISGTIKGDVEADVEDSLVLESTAVIEGNLKHKSRNQLVSNGGTVMGQTEWEIPQTSIFGIDMQDSLGVQILRRILSQLHWFLGIVLVGLLLLWIFPNVTQNVAGTPFESPWKSLGMGALMLIVAPIVIIIVAVLGFIVGGFAAVPVLLVPGAAYVVLLSLAAPIIALVIGGFTMARLMNREDFATWQALLIGAAILAIIGLIPFVDKIVGILTILFGFGAWLLYLYRAYSEGREAETI